METCFQDCIDDMFTYFHILFVQLFYLEVTGYSNTWNPGMRPSGNSFWQALRSLSFRTERQLSCNLGMSKISTRNIATPKTDRQNRKILLHIVVNYGTYLKLSKLLFYLFGGCGIFGVFLRQVAGHSCQHRLLTADMWIMWMCRSQDDVNLGPWHSWYWRIRITMSFQSLRVGRYPWMDEHLFLWKALGPPFVLRLPFVYDPKSRRIWNNFKCNTRSARPRVITIAWPTLRPGTWGGTVGLRKTARGLVRHEGFSTGGGPGPPRDVRLACQMASRRWPAAWVLMLVTFKVTNILKHCT